VKTISNIEIADVLLRAGKPVTFKEIVVLMNEHHPNFDINTGYIRQRLVLFARSRNCVCVIDKDARPVTYHMQSIFQEFFRGSRDGRVRDFSHTIIRKKAQETEGSTSILRRLWPARPYVTASA